MVKELLRRHPGLRKRLREPAQEETVDLVSIDGRWGIDVAENLRGVRDLSAHALELARWVSAHSSRQAALVVVSPRITPQMESEWAGIQKVLRKDVAQRLSLVAPDRPLRAAHPPAWAGDLLEALRKPESDPLAITTDSPAAPTTKLFDVVKVLLNRWLRREGPIRVLALAEQAGCSYPTVFKAIARLDRYGELSRTSRRSVTLKDFPTRTWGEIQALLPSLRETALFIDATGRRFDPHWLLTRLKKQAPDHVALGGVEAARHWHPRFNLNGIPRLDLVVHAPDPERYDLSFVSALDPALTRTPAADPRHAHQVVLAVHRISRRLPLFEADPRKGMPFADPVEVLLDLHDLRLIEQAEELIHVLTEKRRRGP